MPSVAHELLIRLIAEHPELLLDMLGDRLGDLARDGVTFRESDANSSQVPLLGADLCLELCRRGSDEPFMVLTVEAQLRPDDDKPRAWFAYQAGQFRRLGVPSYLLVITNDPAVTAWAAGPFCSGHTTLRPWVLGPGDIPPITDPEEARRSLPLTFVSGIVHGREPIAAQIGVALARALGDAPDDAALYFDAFLDSLEDAVKEALHMQLAHFKPRSDWGKSIFAKGEAEGRAKDILILLEARGLPITDALRERVMTCTDLSLLDRWFRRATTAVSIHEAFAP